MTRAPTTHRIKIWAEPFKATLDGLKVDEFRLDDRNYQVGDRLHLVEWIDNPEGGYPTGRELIRLVTYLTRGPAFGVPRGYVVLSVQDWSADKDPR